MRPAQLIVSMAALLLPAIVAAGSSASSGASAPGPRILTIDSPSSLIAIRIGVPAGSAQDPPGKEGLASLTAQMLLEGSFGDPSRPTTKEELAEITRPWGQKARPEVLLAKETTTFAMTIPEERLPEFLERILKPMFSRPLFAPAELDRIRSEHRVELSQVRFESQEELGLRYLDDLLHEGTSLQHLELGTAQGLRGATVGDLRRFFGSFYRSSGLRVALSTRKEAVVAAVGQALLDAGGRVPASPLARSRPAPAVRPKGRSLTIVAMPEAISTGIHAGFPIAVTRSHPDYWPLFIANVWFGTHRDSFGHLYQAIRQARGYNYGDYSYIEWMPERPSHLFPPPNHPRSQQDFAIWLRPVGHAYVHHLLKALLFELEELIARGLSDEQVALAKTKAKVLYLNLAEDTERRVAYRLDDDFYDVATPYLEQYLAAVEAVTPAQVNAAIRRHLQTRDVKLVVVTDDEVAPALAEEVAHGGSAYGKGPADYSLESRDEGGAKSFVLTPEQLEMLRRDGAWAGYPLWIGGDRIRVVKAGELFETTKVVP